MTVVKRNNSTPKPSSKLFNTKVDWCINRHKSVLDRFSGGISVAMVCRGMRKKGYGYDWTTAQRLLRAGIHGSKKAKEFSDMLFDEYGVFVPYLELIGYCDVITNNLDGEEI